MCPPHSGQVTNGSSVIFCHCSKRWLHVLHRYSYVGIRFSPLNCPINLTPDRDAMLYFHHVSIVSGDARHYAFSTYGVHLLRMIATFYYYSNVPSLCCQSHHESANLHLFLTTFFARPIIPAFRYTPSPSRQHPASCHPELLVPQYWL